MGGKRCIAWTTQWWWTTTSCSYIWTSSTLGHSTTSVSCGSYTSTWTNVNILFTHTSILNTCWVTRVRSMGEDMFAMQHIERRELAPKPNLSTIVAYNKMHIGFFFLTTISFHLYLIGSKTFKVTIYISRFWVCFWNLGFGFKL